MIAAIAPVFSLRNEKIKHANEAQYGELVMILSIGRVPSMANKSAFFLSSFHFSLLTFFLKFV